MAIYANEHMVDLLNEQYDKVRELEKVIEGLNKMNKDKKVLILEQWEIDLLLAILDTAKIDATLGDIDQDQDDIKHVIKKLERL